MSRSAEPWHMGRPTVHLISNAEQALEKALPSPVTGEINENFVPKSTNLTVSLDEFIALSSDEHVRSCTAKATLHMGATLGTVSVPIEYITTRSEAGQPFVHWNKARLEPASPARLWARL